MIKIKNHPQYIEYVKCCREMREYLLIKTNPPQSLQDKYKDLLRDYTDFLDDMGYIMPYAIYEYDIKDKSTWRYLDCVIDGVRFLRDIGNPGFRYFDKI